MWRYVWVLVFLAGCMRVEQKTTTPVVMMAMSASATPSPAVSQPPSTPASPTPVEENAASPATVPTAAPTAGTPAAKPAAVVSKTDNASFAGENYPDNSVVRPGEAFVKVFEIKNIGKTTWTTAYLIAVDMVSQGEAFGSPSQMNFPQETAPGKTLRISIPLIAPARPGSYEVYWVLKNDRGEIVGVDGSNLWIKVQVCDPNQTCKAAAAGNPGAGSINASLTEFIPGKQSTSASFCMTLRNPKYGPGGGAVSLKADPMMYPAASGEALPSPGCFKFVFPVGAAELKQYVHLSVVIHNVRVLGGASDADCAAAHSALVQQYAGLDFQCDLGSGNFYKNAKLPAGMTAVQAQQIIVDGIEQAVYGPWELKVK